MESRVDFIYGLPRKLLQSSVIAIILSGAVERKFKWKLRYLGYRLFFCYQKFVELGAIYLTCWGTEDIFKMIAKVPSSFKHL